MELDTIAFLTLSREYVDFDTIAFLTLSRKCVDVDTIAFVTTRHLCKPSPVSCAMKCALCCYFRLSFVWVFLFCFFFLSVSRQRELLAHASQCRSVETRALSVPGRPRQARVPVRALV